MYEIKKLLSVCDIVKQRPNPFGGYRKYVATGDIKKSEIISFTEVTYGGRPSRADCTVYSGDVLFAKMAGTEKTLVAESIHEDMIFSTGFVVLKPKPETLDSKFLYHILRSNKFLSEKDRLSTGATQKAITNKSLGNIKISLPPLDEQRKISSILDKADEIKSLSERVLHLRQQLILSTFNEMFGDLRINSKSWPEKSISELCSRVSVGYVGPLTILYVESGIRCLRGLNIKRGKISSDNIKQISQENHDNLLKKSRLNAGDVVSIRTGNAGVSAVISEEYDDVNCADLIIMTPTSEIVPSYLCEFLNQKFGDSDSIQGAVGAIQKHFNIGSVKKVMVPLPPLELQNQYHQILDTILHLDNQIEFTEKISLSLTQEMLT